jgi:transcription-repair coupling factor (superfamily II helicase)
LSANFLTSSDIKMQSFLKKIRNNYSRVEKPENPSEYSIRGDVLSIWLIGYKHPVRMEFFDEELEKIYSYDEVYGRKLYDLKKIVFSEAALEDKSEVGLINVIQSESSSLQKIIFVTSITSEIQNLNNLILTDFQYPQLFYSRQELLLQEINRLKNLHYQILIKTNNHQDLNENLQPFTTSKIQSAQIFEDWNISVANLPIIQQGQQDFFDRNLHAGVVSEKLKLAIFTDREIFGSIYLSRPERKLSNLGNLKKLLLQFEGDIQIGDYVVHEDYGIGVYSGLTQQELEGEMLEYLLLKYDKDDELYVPIHQIEKLTKYIGSESVPPKLTRLGKQTWQSVKDKIKKSTGLLARELVEHYALREVSKSEKIEFEDSEDYKKFVDEFKHTETEDQLRATNEIIEDLSKLKPMNRLLVGDVGFGKTEVFMRAAFKIVENGGQVAVLAPTTILTAQHFAVFEERFKNFPISIKYLSRFNTPEQNNKIIDELNLGKVDIIVGTHRLLSSDVQFKNLMMVVVDEEQRFGVKQKEKIKQLNYGVHVLSVSATPIPRTLGMALSSIQEISIITQPPKNRKPIQTKIIKNDWNQVAKAIEFEIKRGGQLYFLHNEVQSIKLIQDRLEKLTPGVKFIYAHGQMNSSELDRVMTEFYEKKYDCLISTTIIENGLDLPNVNTIIVNKAQRFGLSQLYQLRGRVGRSERESFCYLLTDSDNLEKTVIEEAVDNSENVKKQKKKRYIDRLQSLVDNQDLGAGFRIASRDLEIRGAGNILGEQQSGHISTIGYALYIEILVQEVERIKNLVKN